MFNTICALIALGCIGVEAYCIEKFSDELKRRSADKKAKRDAIGRARAKAIVAKRVKLKNNRTELFSMISEEE